MTADDPAAVIADQIRVWMLRQFFQYLCFGYEGVKQLLPVDTQLLEQGIQFQ